MARPRIPFSVGDAIQSWRDVTYLNVGNAGSAGSAQVFIVLATSGPLRGVRFAVKMFAASDRDGWRRNFMREAHVLRDCDHPAIVKMFGEGVYKDEYPFFVMDYLPHNLSKKMNPGELSPHQKIVCIMQLLSALNYLSRRDPPTTHRDIKPTNIFLNESSCVLGDFGLVHQEMETAKGERGGFATTTAPEMARYYRTPELVEFFNKRSPNPSPASDVFQLGLVAAELFTGANPLKPGRPEEVLEMLNVPEIPGTFGTHINLLIEQMLIQMTTARPTAAKMLGLWQDLFLKYVKENKIQSAPRAARKTQVISRRTEFDRPSIHPERKFGEGVLDDDDLESNPRGN